MITSIVVISILVAVYRLLIRTVLYSADYSIQLEKLRRNCHEEAHNKLIHLARINQQPNGQDKRQALEQWDIDAKGYTQSCSKMYDLPSNVTTLPR